MDKKLEAKLDQIISDKNNPIHKQIKTIIDYADKNNIKPFANFTDLHQVLQFANLTSQYFTNGWQFDDYFNTPNFLKEKTALIEKVYQKIVANQEEKTWYDWNIEADELWENVLNYLHDPTPDTSEIEGEEDYDNEYDKLQEIKDNQFHKDYQTIVKKEQEHLKKIKAQPKK